MGLNSVRTNRYVPDLDAFQQIVGRFLVDWKRASTLEQRLSVESRAITYFQELIDFTYDLEKVSVFEHPNVRDFDLAAAQSRDLLLLNLERLRSISRLYIKYFNNEKLALLELIGSLRRARQKRATLSLWNQATDKHVISENFLNFNHLDYDFIQEGQLTVDTAQGLATLPVKVSSNLGVGRIRVGSKSRGVAGNSDLDIQTDNSDPAFLLDGNPDTWFEYERLDTGPCELQLTCELNSPEIVNQISIEPVNLGSGLTFEIQDIVFTDDKVSTGIRDLLPTRLPDDFFTVKPVGRDTHWATSFLPVKCRTISISFKQASSYTVRIDTVDERIANRQRFAVALRSIEFRKNEYEDIGGINSREVKIPGALYAAESIIDIVPASSPLYAAKFDVSSDGGETWTENVCAGTALGVGENCTGTTLLDGESESFLWRLHVERKPKAFSDASSFTDSTAPVELNFFRSGVSKAFSPVRFQLPERPQNKSAVVYQPGVARFSDKLSEAVLLARARTAGAMNVALPFDLQDDGLDFETMHVLLNRQELVFNPDNASLAAGEYGFDSTLTELELVGVPDRSRIEVIFDEEVMLLQEQSDGFYHGIPHNFDPEKENIRISYLPATASRRSRLLPMDRATIDLGHRSIVESSFEIVADSVAFVSVASRNLVTADTDYYLDPVRGILYLNNPLGQILGSADSARTTFLNSQIQELSNDQFSVVVRDMVPWGVRINRDAVAFTTVSDNLNAGPQARLSVLDQTEATRPDIMSANPRAMTLSYDHVVIGSLAVPQNLIDTAAPGYPVEMPFMDGNSEFLGLTPMNNESTFEITADSTGVVSFALAAREGVYSPLGVTFSDTSVFSTLVSTPSGIGQYSLDLQNGLVSVYVGPLGTLAAGIEILYYYKDPLHDSSNRYSVDYENGILYASEDLNSVESPEVTYKATNYKIAFDLVRKVDKYEYDSESNTVSLRTEGLSDVNALVKTFWAKPQTNKRIAGLERYFSPILLSVGFRFQ